MNPSNDLTNRALADLMNDCSIDRIMAIDNNWKIIAWNHTAEVITGIPRAAVIDKGLLDVFPEYALDKELLSAIEIAFSGIKSFVPAQKGSFNRQHYENHFIPLRDADDLLLGVMNIMHDVAHRIRAEQQLYQLNMALRKKYEQLERATDELATIAYITSNNIMEPLRQVYSSIELLIRAEAQAMSDGGKANLRRMQASLNRMNLLLDDIQALSGIHSPADGGVPTALNAIAKEAIEKLRDKLVANNVQVEVAELPSVKGHHELLQYLFFHLISNALRFRKNNEPLTLTINGSERVMPDIDPESNGEMSYTRISFTDNGTGFMQEEAERIFQMADRGPQRYAGGGAGLAICRKIMIAHDGYIQAEGWLDKGAVYHCYFPAT